MTETTSSRSLARRLVAGAVQPAAADALTAMAGAESACECLYSELSQWVGDEGSYAMFNGTLIRTCDAHPVLNLARLQPRPAPNLLKWAEGAQAHGPAAVAEALEAMLVKLIELLGRLIGDDMAMRLVEHAIRDCESGDTNRRVAR